LVQDLSPEWELELMLIRSLKEIFGSFSIIIHSSSSAKEARPNEERMK
jgi:hypothetical protein